MDALVDSRLEREGERGSAIELLVRFGRAAGTLAGTLARAIHRRGHCAVRGLNLRTCEVHVGTTSRNASTVIASMASPVWRVAPNGVAAKSHSRITQLLSMP